MNKYQLVPLAMNKYQLVPKDGHKSFYGKAVVKVCDGCEYLQSYGTTVLSKENGVLTRHWTGWSATTGRHIKAFCGLNKGEFLDLPYGKIN